MAIRIVGVGAGLLLLLTLAYIVFATEQPSAQMLALQAFIGISVASLLIMATVVYRQHRQAKASLAGEARQRLILNVAGSGGWDIDLVSGETIISARLMQQLGYRQGEIEFASDWLDQYTHPHDLALMHETFVEHVKGNTEIFECELRLKHKQGHYVWMLVRGSAESHDREGRVTRIVGATFDIEARKNAEQALRQSEHQFRDLVEGSIQGILIHSTGATLFVNQACAEIFGYTDPDEVIALDSRFRLYAEHEHERMKGLGEQRFSGNNPPDHYEFDGVKKDGSIIHLDTMVRLIDWKGQEALQVVLVDITEQKKAAEAMRASELRYRSLFDSAPVALFESNWSAGRALIERLRAAGVEDIYAHMQQHPELIRRRSDMGELTNVNREALRIYRADDKESLIDWIQQSPLEEIPAGLVERMVQHASGQHRDTQESESLRLDGEKFAARVTSQVVSADSEDWTHMLTMELDISAQKAAETKLRESEQRFRDLVEGSVQGIVIFTYDWDIRFANLALAEFLGHSQVESILDIGNWEYLLAPDDVARMLDYKARRLRGEPVPSLYETNLIKADGGIVNVLMSVRLVDWLGESAIQCTLSDLTDRKQAEVALQQSEVRYRRLFETAPVSLWEQDWSGLKRLIDQLRDEGIADISAHLKKHPHLIGRRADVSKLIDVNTETLRLYAATDKQNFHDTVQNAPWQERDSGLLERIAGFVGGSSRVVVENIGTRMDGTSFPIRITTEIVGDDLEDWSRIYTSEQDITEEVESAERLATYRDELRSLAGQMSLAEESERRRIASDLHDGTVQNLIVARMNLSIIADSLRSKRSKTMADNTDDLIGKSLEETRSMIFELSPPVLYEVGLKAAIEWLGQQFQQRSDLVIEFDNDDSEVELTPELKVVLFQAVRELMINITKHARASQVKLSWSQTDDCLQVEVEDDGIGFNLGDVGSRPSSEGGFGLFSIRERLSLLGAKITFQSSASGTRVTITAPIGGDQDDA